MVGDNKSPGYEYTIPTKTINTGTTDTVNCGTIHTVAYDANGGTYGKDAAGNDIPGPEDMTKYYGTSIVVSSNTPTRIGYNFTQWKSDTTGTSYNPGTGYAYSQRGGTDTLSEPFNSPNTNGFPSDWNNVITSSNSVFDIAFDAFSI